MAAAPEKKDRESDSSSPTRDIRHAEGTDVDFMEPDGHGSEINHAKVLRKMDYRIIPIVTVLYLLSFLDRGNIGNARILGMEEDLELTGNRYNIAYTVFFFPYALLELPANLLLKKLSPSIWLPSIMLAWGLVTTLTGIVQGYNGLVIARVFLGIAEAGQYPGCAYYLSIWYQNSDMGFRQGMFFSAAALAGSFSGLLAFGLSQMDGVGGLAGWRWIFIIEGIVTCLVGVVAFFVITDTPEKATWLTETERNYVIERVRYKGTHNGEAIVESETFKWKYIWRAVTDWQCLLGVLVNYASTCTIYGMSAFLPSIVNQLGYSGNESNLLTIPIYAVACILTIAVAKLSDRFKIRSPIIIALLFAELVGYSFAIAGANQGVPGLVYAGVFIATGACYPAFILIITWIISNVSPSYKRAAGTAVLVGLGNLSGAMAPNFYRSQDAPEYILGHSMEMMMVAIGLIMAVVINWLYRRANKAKDRAVAEGVTLTAEELVDMGDRAPTFKYNL